MGSLNSVFGADSKRTIRKTTLFGDCFTTKMLNMENMICKVYFFGNTYIVLTLANIVFQTISNHRVTFFTIFFLSQYNKGCTRAREFLYIRNSHPQLKLTLIAEKCTAGMHVNTHSCPLRTQKLTIIHRFQED